MVKVVFGDHVDTRNDFLYNMEGVWQLRPSIHISMLTFCFNSSNRMNAKPHI